MTTITPASFIASTSGNPITWDAPSGVRPDMSGLIVFTNATGTDPVLTLTCSAGTCEEVDSHDAVIDRLRELVVIPGAELGGVAVRGRGRAELEPQDGRRVVHHDPGTRARVGREHLRRRGRGVDVRRRGSPRARCSHCVALLSVRGGRAGAHQDVTITMPSLPAPPAPGFEPFRLAPPPPPPEP